jgi:hypothetical protein
MFGYGPIFWFVVIIVILLLLWLFCGGKNHEVVGLRPLDPRYFNQYSGSPYDYGITTNNYRENVCTASTPIRSVGASQNRPRQMPNQAEPAMYATHHPADHSHNTHLNSQPREIPIQIPSQIIPVTSSITMTSRPIMPTMNVAHPPQPVEAIQMIPNLPPHIPSVPQVQQSKALAPRVSKGQAACCRVLEGIYNRPFRTIRPSFLRNPETGRNLELDCYNEELKLALEYNGIQHYRWPNFTNQSREEFLNQVRRDQLKVDLCDLNKVYLITVPYNVAPENIEAYIRYYLPEEEAKRRAAGQGVVG